MSTQRTAKSDFTVGPGGGLKVEDRERSEGTAIRAGEVVTISTKTRLKALVQAGVVAETDEEDADVPKRPPPAPPEAERQASGQVESATVTAAQGELDAARQQAVRAHAELDAAKAKGDDAARKTAETDVETADRLVAEAQGKLDKVKAESTKAESVKAESNKP